MNEAPRYATLRDYLRVLRRNRLLIVAVTLVFGAAALALSLAQEKVYSAEAAIAFENPQEGANLFGTPVGLPESTQQQAAEAAAAATSAAVLGNVITELDLQLTVNDLRSRISTLTESQTSFLVIRAEASDPNLVSAIANTTASELADLENRQARQRFEQAADSQREELETFDEPESVSDQLTLNALQTRVASLESLAEFARAASVIRFAPVPTAAVSPSPVRNTGLGLLVGLTLAIVAAFVRDSLDRRMRASSEVEDQLGLPLLGHIGEDALGRSVTASDGRPSLSGQELEAVRILRMNLDFLDVDRALRSVLVTSPLPEEGKTSVASSLAYASALAGRRVVILECDLRRGTLADRFGVAAEPGLTDVLAGRVELEDAKQVIEVTESERRDEHKPWWRSRNGTSAEAEATELPADASPAPEGARGPLDTATEQSGPVRLTCISGGARVPRPAELLGSRRLRDLLAGLEREYDLVVLDTSPLLAVVDTLELLPHVDGILVCIRSSRTTRDHALATKAVLDRFPVKPTGVVLTGVRPGEEIYYGHYSYAYGE